MAKMSLVSQTSMQIYAHRDSICLNEIIEINSINFKNSKKNESTKTKSFKAVINKNKKKRQCKVVLLMAKCTIKEMVR